METEIAVLVEIETEVLVETETEASGTEIGVLEEIETGAMEETETGTEALEVTEAEGLVATVAEVEVEEALEDLLAEEGVQDGTTVMIPMKDPTLIHGPMKLLKTQRRKTLDGVKRGRTPQKTGVKTSGLALWKTRKYSHLPRRKAV